MNGFKEVASGVFIADGAMLENPVRNMTNLAPPTEILQEAEVSGQFFSATHFGRAGVDAGKSINYGQGVMRDIALRMVGLEAQQAYSINGQGRWLLKGTPDRELYDEIYYMMNSPDLISRGSRQRLLLESDLVYEIWRAGEGHPPRDWDAPRFGKVGHRIISMVMLFQPEFVELKLAAEPDE